MEYEFIENPIVGKFYNVPCVRADRSERYVAILPLLHADPQFGTIGAMEHYHFDTRFFSKLDFLLFARTDGIQRISQVHIADESFPPNRVDPTSNVIKVCLRKCQRTFSGIESLDFDVKDKTAQGTVLWYKRQIGKSCAGRICPHFRQLMLERDGVLECPYHGLIGDIKTEKIIGNIHGITGS